MNSVKDLVADANTRVTTIRAIEAVPLLDDRNTLFVDLRDSAELQSHRQIPGAVHVNRGLLEFVLDPTMAYHLPIFSSGKRFILYCASGGRSALAADTAQRMGLTRVLHLGGGFKGWLEASGPVTKA